MRQIATERQCDKMESDMEVHMKQLCVMKLLHAEKNVTTDIQGHSLNISGEQTVDVSAVSQWMMCFGSSNSRSPPPVQIFMCGMQLR